jgi:hypothetical protein
MSDIQAPAPATAKVKVRIEMRSSRDTVLADGDDVNLISAGGIYVAPYERGSARVVFEEAKTQVEVRRGASWRGSMAPDDYVYRYQLAGQGMYILLAFVEGEETPFAVTGSRDAQYQAHNLFEFTVLERKTRAAGGGAQ